MIAPVISQLIKLNYSVIIVDDGSTDRTDRSLRSLERAVTHPVNLGQGAALQTGIKFALRLGADYIITFDVDGQHQAADIAPRRGTATA